MEGSKLYGFYSKNLLLEESVFRKVQTQVNNVKQPKRGWWKTKSEEYLLVKLLKEWSLHGVKYIFQANSSMPERIFWLITVLASIGMASYLSYDAVQKYHTNPITITFQPTQTSVSQIPFPAVTICNVNLFKKSRLEQAFRTIEENKDNITEALEQEIVLLKEFDHVCGTTKSFSAKFNASQERKTLHFEVQKLVKEFGNKSYSVSVAEVFSERQFHKIQGALQRCDEMIHLCVWEGEEINCTQNFVAIKTEAGLCCTFNMMPLSRLLNLSGVDPAIAHSEATAGITKDDYNGWEKFSKNFDNDLVDQRYKPTNKHPRHQSKAGQSRGLSLLLNPGIDEYYCGSHDSYGYRAFAHSPIEIPHVLKYGFAVGPNIEMFISVQAEVTVADEDIRDLDPEARKCYFLDERRLESFIHYTSSNCVDECMMKEMNRTCGCIVYDMLQTKKNYTVFCAEEKFPCVDRVKRNFSTLGTRRMCGDCLPSCNRIMYQAGTSSFPLRTDINLWKHPTRTDWSNKNVTVLHVYFGSDTVYTRVRKRLFGFSQLFSYIGGVLGLCVGFSVISLIEPLYFLFRLARRYLEINAIQPDKFKGKVVP